MNEKDDRVDYVKLEKEKKLTKFYIKGFKNQQIDTTILDEESKEAYVQGLEAAIYELQIKKENEKQGK